MIKCTSKHLFAKDATTFEAHCSGLSHQFQKGNNLNQFMKHIKELLEIQGMDMITYLPDPADATVMCIIIEEHICFTAKYVSTVATTQKMKYDIYDVQNDTTAIQMLKASLGSHLVQQIKNQIKSGMIFIKVWMILIRVVQTDSVDKYDKFKQDIKACTLFLYPRHTKMAQAMHEAGDNLVAAGFYEQTLTLAILKAFLLANGSEFYKQELLQLHSKVSTKILQIHWLLHDDNNAKWNKTTFHMTTFVILLATCMYTTDTAKQCWLPALNNQDAKIPPQVLTDLSIVEANALQQKMHNCACSGFCPKDRGTERNGGHGHGGNGC